jgi:hypothetical protein
MAAGPIDWRLYAPFRRLLPVEIDGQVYQLPENNPLLRGIQFLDPDCLTYGNFCWNADCRTCVVHIQAGAPDGPGHYLACQVEPVAGMRLAAPPQGVRLPAPGEVRVYADINDGGPAHEPARTEPAGGDGSAADVDDEGPGIRRDDPADPGA